VRLTRGFSPRPQLVLDTALTRSLLRSALALSVSFLLVPPPGISAPPARRADSLVTEAAEPSKVDCELNSARGDIQHVIYLQFSHLQFHRDNPNVPSDLELMPRLLRFLESNGTLLTNHHTSSEPASDALTSLTGLYLNRRGSDSAAGSRYWTTHLDPSPANPNEPRKIVDEEKSAPAPWVPFTRAGCNVGVVAAPRMALENTGRDILNVFGPNSLEAALAADPSTVLQAAAELQGIAIHCAAANPACSFGVPDLLPDEPRGYEGFKALFGIKNASPIISPSAPLLDLSGNLIADAKGIPGFPGSSAISASQSLAYVAAMQEHGVPITFGYISDAHRSPPGESGPAEATYVAQLQANDDAFDKFLTRLAADGINQNNTLFIVSSDDPEHETTSRDSNTTFLGIVGPGITLKGVQNEVWSDHADTRPTMLTLLGLKDDYLSQGRPLVETFQVWALPSGVRDSSEQFVQLAQAYKRINAPVAELSLITQHVSTAALAVDETKRNNLQAQLHVIGALRNDLSAAMANLLNTAAFQGRRISDPEARQLVRSADDLTEYVKLLAANGW
jgi:hypothetical protein